MESDSQDTGSVSDAARFLKISRNAAYEAIKRNEIPHITIGRRIIVSMKRLREKLSGAA